MIISLEEMINVSKVVTVNVEIFAWGLFSRFSRFRLLPENYPHAKIKPKCLYEGNMTSFVKITPMRNVLPTYSRNFPPAKITTFTVVLRFVMILNQIPLSTGCWLPSC